MAKSAGEHIGNALKNAVNIKKIVDAFLRGGWKAAALETAKRYWPYVLIAGIVAIMLPLIIFVSTPAMLFGGIGSDGITAEDIFNNYDDLCNAQVDMLVTEAQSDPGSAVEITGEQMPISDVKALLCVLLNNDISKMSADSVFDLVSEIIVSDTYILPEDEVRVYKIQYLSMEEYMERSGFTESEKNWARLLRENILTEETTES